LDPGSDSGDWLRAWKVGSLLLLCDRGAFHHRKQPGNNKECYEGGGYQTTDQHAPHGCLQFSSLAHSHSYGHQSQYRGQSGHQDRSQTAAPANHQGRYHRQTVLTLQLQNAIDQHDGVASNGSCCSRRPVDFHSFQLILHAGAISGSDGKREVSIRVGYRLDRAGATVGSNTKTFIAAREICSPNSTTMSTSPRTRR
jgi:hypothetical protein